MNPFRIVAGWFASAWRNIDETWLPEGQPGRRGPDVTSFVVLVVVALALTLQEYWGQRDVFRQWFPVVAKTRCADVTGFASWTGISIPDPNASCGELIEFVWWSGWRCFGYVVLPIIAICFLPGQKVSDYFVRVRGIGKHAWIYLGLLLLVMPAVIIASRTAEFQRIYPFYKLAGRSTFDFVAWQVLYALQFASLEFFFRGFMLRGLAPRMGHTAIFVMLVPYCMIHFGKAMPETLGAIIAGFVLGTLAMRTRSIWGGAALHIAVAVAMDLLAVK